MLPKLPEKVLALVWNKMLYQKYSLKYVETVFLMFLFRLLDNDDAPTMKMTDKTDEVKRSKRKLLLTFKISQTKQILLHEHESQLQITNDKDQFKAK